MTAASRALLSRAALSPLLAVASRRVPPRPPPPPSARHGRDHSPLRRPVRPAGRGATPRSRQPRLCGTRPSAGATGRRRRRSSSTGVISSTGSSSWSRRPATKPILSPRVTRSTTVTTLAQVLGSYVSGSISFQLVLLVIVWCVSSGK
jgi:hypothetical protein